MNFRLIVRHGFHRFLRSKGSVIMMIFGVVLALASLIVTDSISSSAISRINSDAMQTGLSSIEVTFQTNRIGDVSLEQWHTQHADEVQTVSYRYQTQGILVMETEKVDIQVYAIDDQYVEQPFLSLISGRFFDHQLDKFEILMSVELENFFYRHSVVGEKAYINNCAVSVAGVLVDQRPSRADERAVYLSTDTFRTIMQQHGRLQALVTAKSISNFSVVKQNLRGFLFGKYQKFFPSSQTLDENRPVTPGEETYYFMHSEDNALASTKTSLNLIRGISICFICILFLVSYVGIGSLYSYHLKARSNEFIISRTLGATKVALGIQLAVEIFLIWLSAATIGIIAGISLAKGLSVLTSLSPIFDFEKVSFYVVITLFLYITVCGKQIRKIVWQSILTPKSYDGSGFGAKKEKSAQKSHEEERLPA